MSGVGPGTRSTRRRGSSADRPPPPPPRGSPTSGSRRTRAPRGSQAGRFTVRIGVETLWPGLRLRVHGARAALVEGAVPARLVAPAGEDRPECRGGPHPRPREVRPPQQERADRLRDSRPPAGEVLRRQQFAARHRQALQRARYAAEARPQRQVGRHSAEHLQGLHLGRLAVRAVDDRQPRHVAQPPAAAAQPPRQVDVLAVHEDPRLEAADLVEGGAAEQLVAAPLTHGASSVAGS